MPWQPIPSVTEPHYLDTNLNQVQKCVNWYLQKTPGGMILMSLQGYQTKGTVANNAAQRGSKFDPNSGNLYSVHGNTVYRINSNGTSVAVTGSLTTSSGSVRIAVGLSHLMIVDGTNGYKLDPAGNTLTTITDGNFPANPVSCACINGQFLVVGGGTDRWRMSAVDDALTWTPLISGRAITNGDQLYHVEVIRDVAYFMGSQSIEPWSASTVDPYLQPISGATMPVGLVTPSNAVPPGVARIKDSIFFYGRGERGRGSFWAIDGGQLSEIATPYIQDKVSEWLIGAQRAFAYTNQGSDFLEIYSDASGSFTGWCYNISTQTWFEPSANRYLTAVESGYTAGDPPIAFNNTDGNVYWMGNSSNPYNSLDGSGITRILDFKIDGGMSRTFSAGLRFEMEVQHDSSSTFTLSATLQKSDDGGRTFDTGITISKAITNGTSAQQVILQSPPLGSFKAGRIYRLTFAGYTARLIIRRAEGLVRVGRF